MEKQWKSEKELTAAIGAMQRQLATLHAPSVTRDIEANSVNIQVLESGFHTTIRDVFGPESPEFAEFGKVQMLQGPLHAGMSAAEMIQARLRGQKYMGAVCAGLIDRLQLKRQQLHHLAEAHRTLGIDKSKLHPRIAETTQQLVADGHHWEAVFAASKALVLHVKNRAGGGDLDGVALMRRVFSKNNPILKFNNLADQTDLDEQEGMMHLYEGAVMALRNPGGHAFPSGADERAIQYIHFLSLLAHRADEASN